MSSVSTDLKARIRRHYDLAAPFYRELWGIHIHHGFWRDGAESKERAQEQLVELLIRKAGIRQGSRVLDIGCGTGGAAIHLARQLHAKVVGITISPVQAQMAARSAAATGAVECIFGVMDAEQLAIVDEFDVIWSVEALSHMPNRYRVLEDAIRMLRAGGKLAITDWFKQPGLSARSQAEYIDPLRRSMLVPDLDVIDNYVARIESLGMRITAAEDHSRAVAKTWEIGCELAKLPLVWRFARKHGSDFVQFLRGVHVMRTALNAGAFRYGLITAEKPSQLLASR
jgi:tocopherol O-methyltransferase